MTVASARPPASGGPPRERHLPPERLAVDRLRASIPVAAVAVVLMALRAPFAMSSLWAEDGQVFLGDALDHGSLAALFEPHQGYFHTLPRLIAGVAATLPLSWAATVTWVLVAAVVAWCVATVHATSAGWIRDGVLRAVLGLSLVAMPALSLESIANAANLQFVLIFTMLVALIDRRTGDGHGRRANLALLVTITGLTSPLAVALLPAVLLRWWRRPGRRPGVVEVMFGATLAAHLLGVATAQGTRSTRSGIGIIEAVGRFGVEVRQNFSVVGGPAVYRLLEVAVVIVLVGTLVVAGRTVARRATPAATTAAPTAVALFAVPLFGLAVWIAACRIDGPQGRYAVVPMSCLAWTLVVAADAVLAEIRRGPAGGRTHARTRLAVVAAISLSWAAGWQPSDYRSAAPSWRAELARAAGECAARNSDTAGVVTAPLLRPPNQWTVQVPCARLDAERAANSQAEVVRGRAKW